MSHKIHVRFKSTVGSHTEMSVLALLDYFTFYSDYFM